METQPLAGMAIIARHPRLRYAEAVPSVVAIFNECMVVGPPVRVVCVLHVGNIAILRFNSWSGIKIRLWLIDVYKMIGHPGDADGLP